MNCIKLQIDTINSDISIIESH